MLPFRTTGQERKERAEKLAIIRLVFATVRVTRSATDDEVARALADWLRFSNSRLTAAKFHRHTVGSVATIFSWHQPEPYHLPLWVPKPDGRLQEKYFASRAASKT
ncbi:uncharacterized protein LOC144113843 isoform X1 [Amblyomma americanum]